MLNPFDSEGNTIKGDIYSTYRPKCLTTDIIREKEQQYDEKTERIEEVVGVLSGKVPFKPQLVHELMEMLDSETRKKLPKVTRERVHIITHFQKWGMPPFQPLESLSGVLDNVAWKALLRETLNGYPIEWGEGSTRVRKRFRTMLISRGRNLLIYLFEKNGKLPDPTNTETISLFNAIKRGEYLDLGISTWDDLMFMTFGRNYFKYKLESKEYQIPVKPQIEKIPNLGILQNKSKNQKMFFKARKKKVLSLIQWYQTTLSLDESLEPDISKTFDLVFESIPKGSILRRPKFLAEIIIFHVLKESKQFANWDLFILISPLGNMALGKRWWLLHYKEYIPSDARLSPGGESPDLYLKRLYDSPKITEEIKTKCEKNKDILIKNFKHLLPRISAGIACYLAIKSTPECPMLISKALAIMGINHPGSIVNAVRYMKERREYNDELFM